MDPKFPGRKQLQMVLHTLPFESTISASFHLSFYNIYTAINILSNDSEARLAKQYKTQSWSEKANQKIAPT